MTESKKINLMLIISNKDWRFRQILVDFSRHKRLVHVVLYVILGRHFGDDIAIFCDENLLSFTFLTGKLRKYLFWTNKKFVYLLS